MEDSNVLKSRREKAEALKKEGHNLFPNSHRPGHKISDLILRFENTPVEDFDKIEDKFSIAGRMMSRRKHGKTTFFDIRDHSGQIQICLSKNHVAPEVEGLFSKLDIGDLMGITGRAFRTRRGELTIMVETIELVTKSFLPLPEKFHEMSVELKYRQRYVDLIMNESSRDVFIKRTRIIQAIRNFLINHSYLEVETPMMQPIPGGATARPFETYHLALDTKMYLRVAPELYLKRLLVGGFDRVFELNRNFRNEGISTQHNPEFTMLEFYQTYSTFEDMMSLSEELISSLALEITGSDKVTYQGTEVNLAAPWKRLDFHESITGIGGAPSEVVESREAAFKHSRELGLDITGDEVHGKILAKIFDLLVEPKLIDPTFIIGYPADISPLARRNENNPQITDRFELFIVGREMANGFSELNDPDDQHKRFLAQVAEREAGDDEALFMDDDYVRALRYGMPPAAGEGLGVDRLVMLLTDSASIRDVILFPHLRPER